MGRYINKLRDCLKDPNRFLLRAFEHKEIDLKVDIPITVISKDNCFCSSDEGEHDNNLNECLVRTRSIEAFVEGLSNKSIIIAPAGAGKTGLCSLITNEGETILPDKRNFFLMAVMPTLEDIKNRGKDFTEEELTENILSNIIVRIDENLKRFYNCNEIVIYYKPRVSTEKYMTKGGFRTQGGKIERKDEFEPVEYWQQVQMLNDFLNEQGKQVLICIDNMDSITSRKSDLEKVKILTAFYMTVQHIRNNCLQRQAIFPVLFVRDDLYGYIDMREEGNKSTKNLFLRWERDEIKKFILKRFINIPGINNLIKRKYEFSQSTIERIIDRKKTVLTYIDSMEEDMLDKWLYSFFLSILTWVEFQIIRKSNYLIGYMIFYRMLKVLWHLEQLSIL